MYVYISIDCCRSVTPTVPIRNCRLRRVFVDVTMNPLNRNNNHKYIEILYILNKYFIIKYFNFIFSKYTFKSHNI